MEGKGKRQAEDALPKAQKPKVEEAEGKKEEGEDEKMEDIDELVFEDDFEDEFEEEEIIENDDSDEETEEYWAQQRDGNEEEGGAKKEGEMEFGEFVENDEDEEDEDEGPKQVWRPSDGLEEGEELEYDPSTYNMLHSLGAQWPCLSFGFIPDGIGGKREKFPHTVYAAAGTQAGDASGNSLLLMKISRLQKTKPKDDSDDEEEDSDEDEEDHTQEDPILETSNLSTPAVNRVKVMPQINKNVLVAMWADTGVVNVYDVRKHVAGLDGGATSLKPKKETAAYTVNNHKNEGFALDWSPTVMGRLLSGDCTKFIYETDFYAGTTIAQPYDAHQGSIEDIQWSPTEKDVFASCSVDTTVKIWDSRASARKAMITVKTHKSDVNTLSWNRKVGYLLATGSDDCSFCIWDLRNFKPDTAVAQFTFHEEPICSIEWNPNDESQLVVVSEDNQVTIWDMGLEADDGEEVSEFPPQLFFIHQGQKEVKEAHWHPQVPNLIGTTSADGFNFFITANSTEIAPPEEIPTN